MAAFSRNKRLTNMLNEDARARFIGVDHRKNSSISTGSAYSSDDDSLSLSELVHGFLEEENINDNDESVTNEFDLDRVDSLDNDTNSVDNSLKWKTVTSVTDPYKNKLHAHVLEALENFTFLRDQNVSIFRKNVAAFLKEKGHDAAVCVTSWESSSTVGVTAGSHEFIDVVKSGSSTWRYFVELDFRAQFQIARPTWQFSEILNSKRTVSFVCDAAKRCFKSRGIAVPPWRKNRFMQNKWFAPCSRTVNPVQGKLVKETAVNSVNCRLIGFDDVVMETRSRGVVVRSR